MSEKPWQQTLDKNHAKQSSSLRIAGKEQGGLPQVKRIKEYKRSNRLSAVSEKQHNEKELGCSGGKKKRLEKCSKEGLSRAKRASRLVTFLQGNLRVKSAVKHLQRPRTTGPLGQHKTTLNHAQAQHTLRGGQATHSSAHNGVYVAASHQTEEKQEKQTNNVNVSNTILEPTASQLAHGGLRSHNRAQAGIIAETC